MQGGTNVAGDGRPHEGTKLPTRRPRYFGRCLVRFLAARHAHRSNLGQVASHGHVAARGVIRRRPSFHDPYLIEQP
jgi:hypothetical protein